ncbi:TIGR04283 family arsenosugar biosynthesis glycosyltransferase [Desulfovibrio sp. TomC]|uniref:TIGR04283 family arsenosugar biosynthesis glycosyltransferase n=1 Tax=Desulfovibrio sp. TomC TaxID=1562888 RepID=UPI0005749688|nr:TIGR04283 family arsenosugar biosynthesis glycosyltransferase [Desulfovibrio sp. TomC]KHK01114.1 glycosyl transferase, family 2 [Desulfovibrio sp. TomC]
MSPLSAPQPLFSVIAPVLGESGRINGLVDNIRTAGYGLPIEIIIVDGDPGQATLRALTRSGVTGLTSPPGRGRQQNAGAALASGEYLLFLHADTRLPAGAFEAAAALLEGRAELGAFSLAIRSDNVLLRLIAAAATWRSRLFSLPYGDQALFLRRDLFEAMGGFADIPIMEDVELVRALRRAGGRVAVSPRCVTTSARRWRAGGILATSLRNLALLFFFSLGVSPHRLARHYPAMPESPGSPGAADTTAGSRP